MSFHTLELIVAWICASLLSVIIAIGMYHFCFRLYELAIAFLSMGAVM